MEFPGGDDHPQMRARARRRLRLRDQTAPETPLTALALGELAQRAGFPPGVLNLVTGDAAAIGQVFCEHEAVRFVGFTGSTEVGKLLMRQAGSAVKKVGLELGGNAPFIVFDDADLDAAVDGAMTRNTATWGRPASAPTASTCKTASMTPSPQNSPAPWRRLKVGDGTADGVHQGPLINAKALDKVEAHIADALSKGARRSPAASGTRWAGLSSSPPCCGCHGVDAGGA